MKETNKIVAKIQKLLAMADESGNASEQERETAMRQATKLMDKHALTMAEIDGTDTSTDPRGQTEMEPGPNLWQPMVFDSIAQLFGVVSYRLQANPRAGRKQRVVLTGRESARITVAAMASYVIHSIERDSRTFQVKGGVRASFKLGAVSGVWSQVRKLQEERRRGETTTAGTALVVVESYKNELDANQQMLADMGIKLRSGNSMRGPRSSAGYSAGVEYGSKLSLNRQVGGSAQRRLSR